MVRTHEQIEQRSLRMARAIAEKLETGDLSAGLERARKVNRRWCNQSPTRLHRDWAEILRNDWPAIRSVLLDPSERGAQLRQNNPFCGILTPQERWAFYRESTP